MRLIGFDLETTGLDVSQDRVIELGVVLWETESKTPLFAASKFLWQEGYPESKPEAFKAHGITTDVLKEFGEPPSQVLSWLEGFVEKANASCLVAHNGKLFDIPFLLNEFKRHGVEPNHVSKLHVIDTKSDLLEYGDSRRLSHIALDHGFINPFPHRALFDVLTMMKVLSKFDIQEIVRLSKIPSVVVRAIISFDETEKREKAKKLGYRWNPDKKIWFKEIKATDVEKEQKEAPFKTTVLL